MTLAIFPYRPVAAIYPRFGNNTDWSGPQQQNDYYMEFLRNRYLGKYDKTDIFKSVQFCESRPEGLGFVINLHPVRARYLIMLAMLVKQEKQYGTEHPRVREHLEALSTILTNDGHPVAARIVQRLAQTCKPTPLKEKLLTDKRFVNAPGMPQPGHVPPYRNDLGRRLISMGEQLLTRTRLGNPDPEFKADGVPAETLNRDATVLMSLGVEMANLGFEESDPQVFRTVYNVAQGMERAGDLKRSQGYAEWALALYDTYDLTPDQAGVGKDTLLATVSRLYRQAGNSKQQARFESYRATPK